MNNIFPPLKFLMSSNVFSQYAGENIVDTALFLSSRASNSPGTFNKGRMLESLKELCGFCLKTDVGRKPRAPRFFFGSVFDFDSNFIWS